MVNFSYWKSRNFLPQMCRKFLLPQMLRKSKLKTPERAQAQTDHFQRQSGRKSHLRSKKQYNFQEILVTIFSIATSSCKIQITNRVYSIGFQTLLRTSSTQPVPLSGFILNLWFFSRTIIVFDFFKFKKWYS